MSYKAIYNKLVFRFPEYNGKNTCFVAFATRNVILGILHRLVEI
jgi:hypothetical protein